MSRKTVTIEKEAFEFLGWKEPYRFFYVRRANGDLRVVELVGMRLPKGKGSDADHDPVKISRRLYAMRFRCEFGDSTVIPFREYKFLPLSLSEISQLERLFPELRKDKPAGGGGGGGGKTPPALRAKRSNAGKRKARVQDPDDILKIKKAFAARTVGGGLTNNAVARELAELVSEDPNALDLRSGPYYNISPDAIRRLVGVKK